MNRGAIVLCGGKSSRMGYAKAMLPFGEERMLQRVVRIVSEVVPREQIVVVAARGQQLPVLPPETRITYDQRENRGPLEGLAAGLVAAKKQVDLVYATSCDVPLLEPTFIERMFQLIGTHQIAIPKEGEFFHPLAACYHTSVLQPMQELLAADRLRPFYLLEKTDSLEIPADRLREVDPQLRSLCNTNTPAEYTAALSTVGLPVPQEWQVHGDKNSPATD